MLLELNALLAGLRNEPQFSGVPVLFIPGSGGSYKQVRERAWLRAACVRPALLRLTRLGQARSLASEAAKQHNAANADRTRVLDWYTFDFQEELSGLDGERRLLRTWHDRRDACLPQAACFTAR